MDLLVNINLQKDLVVVLTRLLDNILKTFFNKLLMMYIYRLKIIKYQVKHNKTSSLLILKSSAKYLLLHKFLAYKCALRFIELIVSRKDPHDRNTRMKKA